LVKKYSDPRVHAIRNLTNMGEYPNRNQALALARGKYFMFIDGDDYLYPHGLSFMVKMMERFPKAGFASAQPPCEKFIYPVELTPHQFCSCVFLGPIVFGADFTQLFFRTECLRAADGFDLRYRTGDTRIQYVMGMREHCLLINGGLAWWRRRPGQASELLTRDRWGLAEMARYGNEVLEHCDCPLSPAEKRIAHANLSRMLMRNVAKFALKGRLVHAARLLQRSGLAFGDWKYLFAKYLTPYLSEVNGENPIRIGIGASLPAFVPAMEGVRRITRGAPAENRLAARWIRSANPRPVKLPGEYSITGS
jgi:glycosyltransferase involved in cell wall biosynthesis